MVWETPVTLPSSNIHLATAISANYIASGVDAASGVTRARLTAGLAGCEAKVIRGTLIALISYHVGVTLANAGHAIACQAA